MRSARIRPLAQQGRTLARRFVRVTWCWVPRTRNQRADALIRNAYRRAVEDTMQANTACLTVESLGTGIFRVASSRGTGWYQVRLLPESGTCSAFARGHRPCKHIVAARRSVRGGSSLPER